MHITAEEMSTEKRKPERDKDNEITLNIPNYGKKEMSPKSFMKGSRNSLLGRKQDSDLEQSFRKLCISKVREEEYDSDSSSSDESSENRKQLESTLVAKCPDKIKDVKKEQLRTNLRPYPLSQTISTGLQSGGTIIPPCNFSLTTTYQIPQTVEDFEIQNEVVTPQDLSDIMKNLNDDQIQLLNNAIDLVSGQKEKEVKIDSLTSIPAPKMRDLDTCNSPDSSYGTMSPASIPPSPFSLHSPNPRAEKRVSESDSFGEGDLSATELPFGPIEIAKMQPVQMVNIKYVRPPPRQLVSCPPVNRTANGYNAPVLAPLFSRPLRPDSIEVNEVGLEKPAADRLREKKLLKGCIVEIEWIAAIQEVKPLLNNKSFTSPEDLMKKSDLRAKLIALILEGPGKRHFYEELYCKVKLYMKEYLMDILTGKDGNGQTPLYIAAISRKDYPIVARLLADGLAQNINRNHHETLDGEGNTILHSLASKGDGYAQVLCELLYSKAFDVNQKNAGCKTALHKAVETHPKTSSLASIKQLVKHGAFIHIQDLHGRTVLHLAVSYPQSDPQVLRALLTSTKAEEAVNIVDKDRNTPLHIVAKRNDLPLEKQKEIIIEDIISRKFQCRFTDFLRLRDFLILTFGKFINLLLLSKARHDLRNKEEKVALTLVVSERKEDVKNLLHRKI